MKGKDEKEKNEIIDFWANEANKSQYIGNYLLIELYELDKRRNELIKNIKLVFPDFSVVNFEFEKELKINAIKKTNEFLKPNLK